MVKNEREKKEKKKSFLEEKLGTKKREKEEVYHTQSI